MRKIFSLLIALALVLSFSVVAMPPVAAAPGTTYYVATGGSDSNGGTSWLDAWKTIQHAVDNVSSGDTIYVAAGTYNEAVVINKGLTSLTLNGANAGMPGYGTRVAETIIQAPDAAHTKAIDIWDDGIIVDGFKLMAGLEDSADIVDVRGDHVVIKNNIITPYSSAGTSNPPGVFACGVPSDDCTDLTVEYNLIQNTGGCGVFLGLYGGYSVTNSLIEGNLIDNSECAGILAYDTDGITIRGNTIRDVGTLGVQHDDGIRAGALGKRLTIEHNEIYGCTNWGIRIVHDAANHIVRYNSIHDNAQGGLRNQLTVDIDASCNWWGTNTAGGVAGEVSTYVDYTPWLDSGTDTHPGPDFQGDLSVLTVDDDSPQTGATGRIQEGVDEVTASTVYVLPGTYVQQVKITKSLDLIGAGEASTTIKLPTSGTNKITVGSVKWEYVVAADGGGTPIDVKIHGFTIDANSQDANTNKNLAGVFFRDVGHGSGDGLYSSTIYNFGTYYGGWSGTMGTWNGNTGVTIYGTSDLTIDDNDIDDYTVSGVSAIGSNVNVTVTGNDLDGTDSGYAGLFLRDGVGTISGNNIHDHNLSGDSIGIYLYDGATGTIIDDSAGPNTIAGNNLGLFLKGTDGATIDGNTFIDNSHKSIVIQQDSDNNVVKGNTITVASPGGANLQSGIYIGSDSGGNVIGGDTAADGNTITLPTSGTGLLYAIWLSGTDTGDVIIKHNTVTGGKRAVQFDGGPGHSGTNTISDNTLTGAAFGGIMSSCHGDFVISGNTITGTDRPLEFWQAGNGDITITCNTISSTAYDAINAGSYNSMIVSYNNIECLAGGYGLHNRGSKIIVAENNWWGDTNGSGPYDPQDETGETTDVPPCSVSVAAMMNPDGTGDSVYGLVDYCPWLDYSAATTTGAGNASFACSPGCINNLTAVSPTPSGCPVYLPYGVFSFNISCIDPGQTVTVTVTLPGPVPAGSVWWKYQNGSWYSLPIGDDDGDNIITITLTDGGQGDADEAANGQIIDDGGPGALARGLIVRSTEGGRVTKPGEGNHVYEPGTIVKLVATPDDGYRFVEWTHDVRRIEDVNAAETTITMDWSYVIIANFVTEETSTVETEVQYELNVSSTMGGSVTNPGEGTFPYIKGTVVSLVAGPDTGYEFVNWTGDGITNADSTTVTVTMNGDRAVKANFEFEQTTDIDSGGESSIPVPVGACFIATAAYGTPTAEQIDVLREFRDVVLLENSVGSEFVALYYQLSPPVADFIAGNSFLKTVVRELVVDPVVWIVEATGDTWRN